MLVGTVKSVSTSGNGAVIDLALQPGLVDQIPANVTAQLLPKTLFGERYVDLQIPDNASARHIASGDVIGQDRTTGGIEVERVLDDLLPVLQAVQPQKLSVTLTAIATALQGRGVQLGQTLSQLGQYVGELNPQLPTLEHDLAALTTTSNTYNQAAPNLINALNDLTVTSQTVVNQQNNLANLYATLSTASGNLTNFLQANENNLIQVSSASMPTLDVLARYSPEYRASSSRWRPWCRWWTRHSARAPTSPACTPPWRSPSTGGRTTPGQDAPRIQRQPRPALLRPAPGAQPVSRSTRRTARSRRLVAPAAGPEPPTTACCRRPTPRPSWATRRPTTRPPAWACRTPRPRRACSPS